ncbi:hypothetical protein QBC36DRAFT_315840 [Triangularia setosa]|uniref:T6SS Phospholipase effector Tle1-like catalytic domain-containing protein n=1 Tax=Triangularia setosa TaxID=2587417 RepID=A0AAN7A295_9PEZI|nr:hypothetical protein QBC36DRAFT_315840 [Podospora setosa]
MSQQGQTSGKAATSSFPLDTWIVVKPTEYLSAGVLPDRDVKKKANHIIYVDGTSNSKIHDITTNEGQATKMGCISHIFTPETKADVVQQLFFLGFSRGAYMARVLASIGHPDVADFRFACDDYEFAEEVHNQPSIKRIFQAAALKEHCENFKCVLYKRKHQAQVLSQVWFPSSHEAINEAQFRKYIGLEVGHIPCDDVADSKFGMWLANINHYRTELGSGVNEKRHLITEQPYFTQYIGILELPDVDGSDDEPIKLEKLQMDEPDGWKKEMLGMMEKHVDGVRGWLADRYHHLHHHTLHGITHAPNLNNNGRYSKTIQSLQTTVLVENGKLSQVQNNSAQQTPAQKTSQSVRKVQVVRRVSWYQEGALLMASFSLCFALSGVGAEIVHLDGGDVE